MEKESRTQKAAKNAFYGAAMQIVYIILSFVSRTIFIRLLNSDYLGLNSLYANILTVLSFAELGIGSAIVFSMYKPIAENDKAKIQALMKLYAKAYQIIGVVILGAGLCVIPFMGYIIKDVPEIKENLTYIYILFLANTAISYFFSYKKTLITASQHDYIVQIYTRVFQVLQIILQCVVLLFFHEYLAYLYIQIICTVLMNIALAVKADKMFPYTREKNVERLSKEESKVIFDNVKALFVYKLGSVILNGTDNILISAIINVSAVGITSNYTLLMNNVTNIIGQAISSLTASVGNLSVKGTREQVRDVMHQLLMICVWLYGVICIGFFLLADEFVLLWLGSDYVLGRTVVFALVFSLYINGVQYAAYTFRTTQGLFVQSRWVPLISAVINIILSIWWGIEFGLSGIFIATGVSRLFTTTLVDPWLVYQNNFSKKPYEFYLKYVLETGTVILNGAIQYFLISLINISGIEGFVVKFIVICVMTNLIFFLLFGWTKDFKNLIHRVTPKFRCKRK